MAYYNGRADFEGNLRHIINFQTNVAGIAGRVNQSATAGFIASQGDINTVLTELSSVKAATGGILWKTADDATVWAYNPVNGTSRALTLGEFNLARALGHNVTVVSAGVGTAAPKAGA